jgi:hypothetical protein
MGLRDGRASVFLGAVSAGLIALGFQGVGYGRSAGTTVFEMLVLTSLVFLEFVAFLRYVEVSIDDWEFGMRIGQLRDVYCELLPELAGVLAMTSWAEESVAMLSARWQPFQKMLSVAGSVGVLAGVVLAGVVLAGVVLGADAGVLAYGVGGPLYLAIGVGACVGGAAVVAAGLYQYRRWCEATRPLERHPSRSRTMGFLSHNY